MASAAALKMGGMKSKMVVDERRDEEIAVVVAIAQAKVQRNAAALTRCAQQFRLELAFDELIVRSLIDDDRGTGPTALFDQCGRIVVPPWPLTGAEVSGQRFLTPRTAHRRCDWRKRRHGFVAARILERDGQRAVAAHRMPENSGTRGIDGESAGNDTRQLLGDV